MTQLIFPTPVIAHRGASHFAPENTLAAFRKAKELGVSWVEFDVMLTADEEVVVIHDEKLDRTTNLKGWVHAHPLSALKSCDAGSWFGKEFCDETISTLQEVIELLNELRLFANIEIKAQKKTEQTVKKVLAVIDRYWKQEQAPLISSFSLPILRKVRENSASSLIGFLMDKWQKDWQIICDDLQAIAVDVNYKLLNSERVHAIKKTGRHVLAYTVNDQAIARKLFSWGVDAVFSDDPQNIM